MTKPPDDIIVWAVSALSGEITPNMRMVAFGYSGDCAVFRFYMEEEPSEEEVEVGEIVAVNFDSGLPKKLKKLDVDFVVTEEPLGKLDTLDFGLFRRRES
ncbi:MAG: hypothetical protein GY807_08855 [Gammaproteobacteria bacterium]|nr:hypothetical protein [Gammaproteobacteria bacterium]